MKSWIRHLLPFGVVRALQLRSELQRIGISSPNALRLALEPATGRRLHRLNFNLLPEGALRGLGAVVDVGANVGDWTADLLALCKPSRVVCIEPDPRLAAALRQRFNGNTAVDVIEAAVGASPGTAEFKRMSSSVFNSLRSPSPEMSRLYNVKVEETVPVEVKPLDLIAPPGRISVLKLDTQGFEREVLRGASETLRRTDYLILEVNFQTHYEGEATFFELDSMLREQRFALANYSAPRGGQRQALYADMLYVRAD